MHARDDARSADIVICGAGIAGTAAAYVGGRAWSDLLAQTGAPKRREVSIGRKRIKVIDSHNHLNIADVARVVKGTPFERQAVTTGDGIIGP